MTVTAVDTSVVIAALLSWHEAHRRCLRALTGARGRRGRKLVLPAPALVESYAVMTRLPAPHRLSAPDALRILSASFEGSTEVMGLTGRQTWRLLEGCAAASVAGGATYDALILACARRARASRLLTLDLRDFRRIAPGGMEIVSP